MSLGKWMKRGAEFKGEAEDSIEEAVDAAVVKGGLATGDRFKVKHIKGRVGEHHSPPHITYSAVIEKDEGA